MVATAPEGLAGKVRVAALPDQFLPQGKQAELLAQNGLAPEGLAAMVSDNLRAIAQRAELTQLRRPGK